MSAHTLEEIQSTLRSAGKRVTVAKRTVAEVLVESSRHLTADEITHAVQRRRPDVSPSTIYRILEEFEAHKIVVHSHIGQTAAVYHLSGAVHGHLICERCGATLEIPTAHFDRLSRELKTSFDFLLDRHHVALSGTCAHCQASPRRRASSRTA